MITFNPPPGAYDADVEVTIEGPIGTKVSYAIEGYPVLVKTVAGSSNYPNLGNVPYIQTVNDGLGPLLLDGSFPKFYNSTWVGGLDYNSLNPREKVMCNFFTYILSKGKNLLVLGDSIASETYAVKGTTGNSFSNTLKGIARILGINLVIKDRDDYAGSLDPTLQELLSYDALLLISSKHVHIDSSYITDQGASNMAEARRSGKGLYICTDHGSNSEPEVGFYSAANKVLKYITNKAHFRGSWDFHPGETIAFNRTNFGNSPIFGDLPDSTVIPASTSDSSVVQQVEPPKALPLKVMMRQGSQTLRVLVEDVNGDVSLLEGHYTVSTESKIKLVKTPVTVSGTTNEYFNLTREDEDGNPPGTPTWEGGEWFPTTHVEIENRNGKTSLDTLTLAEFFYEIANYNLVLNSIDHAFDMIVTDTQGNTKTEIVGIAGVKDTVVVMSNVGSFGAEPPITLDLDGVKPTNTVGGGGAVLTTPTAWYSDLAKRKLLVYTNEGLNERASESSPTRVTGTISNADAAKMRVLTGPVSFINIPGGGRSRGKIPVWSSYQETNNTSLPTKYIGTGQSLIVNPTGWYEIQPGLFTPYWE